MALDNNFGSVNSDDPNSSYNEEQRTKELYSNADLSKAGVSPDEMHRLAVNAGHEGMFAQLGEQAASGRASQHNNVLMAGVDKNQEGLDKSVHDEMKSKDLSASRRIISGTENDGMDGIKSEHLSMVDDMTDFPPPSDTQQVIQAVYGFMMFAGFPEGQLAAGMGAEAKQTDLETAEMANMFEDNAALQALYEIADDMGLGDDMQQYIQDAHAFHIQDMDGAGIKDLPQLVGVEPEPVETVVTPDMDPVLKQQLDQQAGLDTPQGPSAFKLA